MSKTKRFLIDRKERKTIVNNYTCRFLQNLYFRRLDSKSESLNLFFTMGYNPDTGYEHFSGGIMSIASIVHETTRMHTSKRWLTLCCTYYGHNLLFRYRLFDSDVRILRFSLIQRRLTKVRKLLLHIPEFLVEDFVNKHLNDSWISSVEDVHINILNQNVELMPDVNIVKTLVQRFPNTTITNAHKSYSTLSMRNLYGVPMHHLSTFVSKEQYRSTTFSHKKNIVLISNDNPDLADKLISVLSNAYPNMQCRVINGISYREYKDLVSRAKFTITLGEGFDGYFIETFLSGGVAFAIRNDVFFDEKYLDLPCLFASESHLVDKVAEYINRLTADEYDALSHHVQSLINTDYSTEIYRNNISDFYSGNYTFK